MKLKYAQKQELYFITSGRKIARIDTHGYFYYDINELLISFSNDTIYWENTDHFKTSENLIIIGIFKETDDLFDKFAEYMI